MFTNEDGNSDTTSKPGDTSPQAGLKTSLTNIGILLGLIAVMLLALGAVIGLGALADKHVDKIQMRLKSQRENRQAPDMDLVPPGQSTPD